MSASPRVVIIGAGIVGTNLADELVTRGWTDITVVEQGPLDTGRRLHLARPGPGLPDQPVQDHDRVRQLHGREAALPRADGVSCFNQVGGLEVATTRGAAEDLKRKLGYATVLGHRRPHRSTPTSARSTIRC